MPIIWGCTRKRQARAAKHLGTSLRHSRIWLSSARPSTWIAHSAEGNDQSKRVPMSGLPTVFNSVSEERHDGVADDRNRIAVAVGDIKSLAVSGQNHFVRPATHRNDPAQASVVEN